MSEQQMETILNIEVNGKHISSTEVHQYDDLSNEEFGRRLRISLVSAEQLAGYLARKQADDVRNAQKDAFFATLRAEAYEAAYKADKDQTAETD